MIFDPPPFRHVEWINERPDPGFDLAWSNIKPDWRSVLEDRFDTSLLPASSPLGDMQLIDHLSRNYGVDKSRVMLVNGCSEGNWLAFLSTIDHDSKVLVEKPVYTPLLEIPKSIAGQVFTIKRRSPGYRFDTKELEAKLSSGIDLFVMQNHNNPSGRALLRAELVEIARILEKYRVPVLCDEVYRDYAVNFTSSGRVNAFPSMAEIYSRAIVTSSVTKVYGAGTLMGGWLVGPKRVINRARRIKIYTVPMVNHIANRTVLEVLRNSHRILPPYFEKIRKNERLVSQWAAGRGDVSWSSPDGCAVGFLTYGTDIPSIELCEMLYSKKDVRVIPGAFFHREKGFRISLAVDYDLLKEALRRIDDLLDLLEEPVQ